MYIYDQTFTKSIDWNIKFRTLVQLNIEKKANLANQAVDHFGGLNKKLSSNIYHANSLRN